MFVTHQSEQFPDDLLQQVSEGEDIRVLTGDERSRDGEMPLLYVGNMFSRTVTEFVREELSENGICERDWHKGAPVCIAISRTSTS